MYGGPIIRHLDDIEAEEMLRFRLADGSIASVWEKWIEMSPRYFAFWNKWDPGAMTAQHGHTGDHAIFILQGEIQSKDGTARAGSHIMLEYGDMFGPWIAGPEGCTMYAFVAAEGGTGGHGYIGSPEVWQEFLTEHGAESLPVPMPKRIPPWWRHRFGGEIKMTNWGGAE